MLPVGLIGGQITVQIRRLASVAMETAVVLSMREPGTIKCVTVTQHVHRGVDGLALDSC